MFLSIITPCFNEEKNIEYCIDQVKHFCQTKKISYEHIIADNKSIDGTREILKKLSLKDKNLKIIFNTRNFDPFKSTFNALKYATGDVVLVSLAADMQDPIEILDSFLNNWKDGYKVVYGIRKNRKDGFLKKIFRLAYYKIYSLLTPYSFGNNVGEFMLIDSSVHKILISIDDQFPYIRGIVKYLNFSSIGVEYDQHERVYGKSRYSIFSHIPQAINAFVSFSYLPVRIILYTGLLTSILSIVYGLFLLLRAIFLVEVIEPGIKTILISIFIFFGITLFFIGILGEYIISIHAHVRKKPIVVEEEKINFDN